MQPSTDSSETSAQLFTRWMNTGFDYYREKRYEEALSAYKQALQYNTRDVLAFVWLAEVLNQLERDEEALLVCQHALDLNASHVEAYVVKVKALMKLQYNERAMETCEQALAFDPEEPTLYQIKGDILTDSQRYQEALIAYTQALQLNPNQGAARIYNSLAILLVQMQHHEQARRSYEQAIQLEPDEATYYFNLGLLLEELDQLEEAGQMYIKAKELHVAAKETERLKAVGTSWEDTATMYLRAPKLL
ncbi:MAG: tetratricopeptide repeat protein [Ktedonobacteraceae bacterium]